MYFWQGIVKVLLFPDKKVINIANGTCHGHEKIANSLCYKELQSDPNVWINFSQRHLAPNPQKQHILIAAGCIAFLMFAVFGLILTSRKKNRW